MNVGGEVSNSDKCENEKVKGCYMEKKKWSSLTKIEEGMVCRIKGYGWCCVQQNVSLSVLVHQCHWRRPLMMMMSHHENLHENLHEHHHVLHVRRHRH